MILIDKTCVSFPKVYIFFFSQAKITAKEEKMIRHSSRFAKIFPVIPARGSISVNRHGISQAGDLRAWKFESVNARDTGYENQRNERKKKGDVRGRGRCHTEAECHKKSPAAHKVTLDFIWRMPNGSRPLRRFRAYFFGVAHESTYAGCASLYLIQC